MTQDETYELGIQAGFMDWELDDGTTRSFDPRYIRFAKLVEDKAFIEGFFAGFEASGEGFNGEYPYGDRGIDITTDKYVLHALKEARGKA